MCTFRILILQSTSKSPPHYCHVRDRYRNNSYEVNCPRGHPVGSQVTPKFHVPYSLGKCDCGLSPSRSFPLLAFSYWHTCGLPRLWGCLLESSRSGCLPLLLGGNIPRSCCFGWVGLLSHNLHTARGRGKDRE